MRRKRFKNGNVITKKIWQNTIKEEIQMRDKELIMFERKNWLVKNNIPWNENSVDWKVK